MREGLTGDGLDGAERLEDAQHTEGFEVGHLREEVEEAGDHDQEVKPVPRIA